MRGPSLLLVLTLLALAPVAAGQFPPPGEELYMLHMQDYEYLPARLEVPPGVTVYAMNFGQEPHTVTDSAQPPQFNAVDIQPGGEPKTFLAPTVPGEYPYYCIYHGDRTGGGMTGTLIVTPTAPSPTPMSTPTPTATSPASSTPAGSNDTPLALWTLILGVGAAGLLSRTRR